MSNFIYKLKNLWYYYWGTDDGKYVIDHLGRKIVFIDKSFSTKEINDTNWAYKQL